MAHSKKTPAGKKTKGASKSSRSHAKQTASPSSGTDQTQNQQPSDISNDTNMPLLSPPTYADVAASAIEHHPADAAATGGNAEPNSSLCATSTPSYGAIPSTSNISDNSNTTTISGSPTPSRQPLLESHHIHDSNTADTSGTTPCTRCQRINSHVHSSSSTPSLSSSLTQTEAILVPKFIAAQVDENELRNIAHTQGPKVAAFYEAQNELIAELLSVNQQHTDDTLELQSEQLRAKQRQVDFAVRISVIVNVFVVLAQLYAAISSRSLALFATMSEAMMDLLSSIILLLASMAARRSDRFSLYPTGRFKLETIGVIVFSVLMGTFSVVLLVESVRALIAAEGVSNQLSIYDAICVVAALVAKIFLYLYCYSLREYHAAHVLMTDHRNDVIVNAFGLAVAIASKHVMPWMDPMGSLIIALIILKSWVEEAWDQIKLIVGIRADPHLLQVLTFTAITHDPRIEKVDRVVAYHSGAKLFVEVDIVMPPCTPLVTIHDVAESLQEKYERMPGVGRCHVHVDYEVTHRSEHQNASA